LKAKKRGENNLADEFVSPLDFIPLAEDVAV